MPQVRVTRRYRFSASHRLHSASLGEAQNFEVYGKCNNPFGHGHDYLLEVAISGSPDAVSGRLVPLRDFDDYVERVILKAVRHRNLNTELPEFSTLVPTTENLAAVVAARLAAEWATAFPGARPKLELVRIHETKRNIFEVRVDPGECSQ
jgi:6-pyruvoyltetrahydropterin/6-carboxytetrahydropterin synthase